MSDEEVPFSANPVDDGGDETNHDNDDRIEIKITDVNDETINLIDNGNITILTDNTSSDFVEVTNDIDSNQNSTTPENDSNESKNSYVIVDVDNDQNNASNKEIVQHKECPIENTTTKIATMAAPSAAALTSTFSVDSIGSEPDVTNVTKAMILCTFVPKHKTATELTVIAGEIVTVLESESIALMDNPLALINDASGDTSIDKIIILDSMHWTKVQSRNGIGAVPSNILKYDENPIATVWTKIKVEHSYMAKAQGQLTISTNEKLQIYGVVTEDEMIMAKRKDGSMGLIPYNFVEIPPAKIENEAMKSVAARHSVSSTAERNRSSISSYHSSKKEQTRTSMMGSEDKRGSVQFVIADMRNSVQFEVENEDDDDCDVENAADPKQKLTRRIKKFSHSISTTIDKIQYSAYKQRTNTLDVITGASKFSTPTGVSSDEVIHDDDDDLTPYNWDAPLNWKRVHVLSDFAGTKEDISHVYEAYIRDKEMRGRHESILNYVADPASAEKKHGDALSETLPSRRKKTESEVLRFCVNDAIEIAGDPSPEGWIFARFVHDKERKGFIPISSVQFVPLSDTSYETQSEMISNNTDIVSSDRDPQQIAADDVNINKSDENQQQLPFHWPFSSYPIYKRTSRSKYCESSVMFVFFVVFSLPILVEAPSAQFAYLWWLNLILICVPWLIIFILRMAEIWTKSVSAQHNPNNRLYAVLLFYLCLIAFGCGLFIILIATFIEYKWIKNHSPVLAFVAACEAIVFVACAALILSAILVAILATFCCRISRNRWETRIEFYCCKREAVKTKRYPRKQ